MSGHRRIFINGLRFPAGDYCEMGNDEQGTNHLIFGEALNYGSPARSGMQMETGVIENPPFTHVWFWKSRLPERKGQPCRVVARG